MDLRTLALIVLRRWFVVVPVLALAAWLLIGTVQDPEQEFTTSAAVMVVSPPDRQKGEGVDQNPYDSIGSERTLARVVAENLNSSLVRSQVASQGLLSGYEVETSRDTPILSIEAVGPDAQSTIATVDAVVTAAPDIVTQVQDNVGAPDATRYLITRISPTNAASAEVVGQNRRLGAILVGAGVLAVFLAVVVDAGIGLAQRRRRGATAPADPGRPYEPGQRDWVPTPSHQRLDQWVRSGAGNGSG